jgi:hypothetical protein
MKLSNDVIYFRYLPGDENVRPVFKNFIALEQTNLQLGNDISASINFLAYL